jgi:hypothetical protein
VRAPRAECATQRGKHNPGTVPKALGLSWEAAIGEARRAGMRQVGLARPDPGEISNGKTNFEFQLNSDFGMTLGNFIRRFIRNLDMRIFAKLF